MTIDSSWIACLKEETPLAFTKHPPFQPDAVFIDGQIRLMPASVDGVVSWEDYIQRQFERHISKYFQRGVSCVVLAFHDYAHVPSAKNMTQTKRRRNLPSLDFNARDCLPPCVPTGEHFTRCISNRAFKSKVIQLVIHRLTTNLACADGQCLVVDYTGAPVRHFPRASGRPPEPIPGLCGSLGEADVKFVPYTSIFPKLQVDSVDGDSLPIALLHMEGGFSGHISILRLETRVKGSEDTAPEAKRQRTGRVYEYVDVRAVYECFVCMVAPQSTSGGCVVSHAGHEISMLVCLIGLSGTDFTRGLPLVSGKTLYDFLPDVWMRLCRSYDPGTRQLSPESALELLVSRIYHKKFSNHAPDSGLGAVMGSLLQSKLSEKTKERLPSPEVLHCTVRNVNWLLRYWRELSPPNPVQPEFGFCRLRSGAVAFEV